MSPRSKLGNRGSKLYSVKLVVLRVLAAADRELLRSDVLDLGWPELFPHRDSYGLLTQFDWRTEEANPFFEEQMACRQHWMRVERDCSVALGQLRKLGLARSVRHDGWAALHWAITPEGVAWLDDDTREFRETVTVGLAALPTFEGSR